MQAHSHSQVNTTSGQRYINRLCKHWAHKLSIEQTDTQSNIMFEGAVCRLSATATQLHVQLDATNVETLERFKPVIADHLQRMAASTEPLQIDWQD